MASINYGTNSQKTPIGDRGKLLPFDKTGTTAETFAKDSKQAGKDIVVVEKNECQNEEGDVMDNNQILEKYIDKVDRDQAALREDIRESERRTAERIADIEQKMDARLNRIEDMIAKSNDRLDSKISSVEGKLESLDTKMDAKFEAFRGELREHRFFKISMALGILGVCLATIYGIATMVAMVK